MSINNKKKNWIRAEERVANLIGGKRTPGSGNKHIRSDVTKGNYSVEVKQTDSDKLTVHKEWLEELETFTNKECCIALFIGLYGVVYYPMGYKSNNEMTNWKTKTVAIGSFPDFLHTNKQIWEFDYIDSLKNWVN
jgi:hypothetical protein